MRNIHPAALVGVLLNFILAWMLFAALANFDMALLSPEDQETVQIIIDAVYAIRPVYYGLLALQMLALALITLRVRFGLGLASIAAFFMLPGSLIYIIGCALTYYRVRYDALATAGKTPYDDALFVYPSSWAPKARIGTGVAMLASLGCLLLGYHDIALILFGVSLAGFYCALRAGRHHALALLREGLVIVPELFAPRLAVAYRDVREATLSGDVIVFDLETRERYAAVEELGAALAAHHVSLR